MIEDIARICHGVNTVIQRHLGEDPSPPWDECDQHIRESTCYGVERAILGATPEELHEHWLEYMTAAGWVWGPVKDEAAKTHPCMAPYAELPAGQQLKDEAFAAVVAAFLAGQPFIGALPE